jgi:transposase-like protein
VAINRVQFQPGMSLLEFNECYGSDQKCLAALEAARWPQGFRCPKCDSAAHSRFERGGRRMLQCSSCRHQASVTAGSMMDSTKLPLQKWLLAMYLLSQAKTGLSALALKRQIGVNYRTAWLMHHKIMQSMAQAESESALRGCKRNLRLARYAVIETKRSEAASATQQSARAPRAQTVFERRARCGAARDHARATSLIVG